MANSKPKLLIVEDDNGLQRQLAWTFEDYTVLAATDRATAIALAAAEEPAVVTLDLGLPPDPDGASEGFATLERMKSLIAHAKIIVVTGNDEREHALKAIAMGAYDFYQKPIDASTIRLIVDRAYRLSTLEEENRRLRALEMQSPLVGLVTASPGMLRVCGVVEKVAPTSVTVLLLGESGTGKEVLARAIHQLSPRATKPFVVINCAAIPENLLESELFGHEKGAFTGAHRQVLGKIELADGGTLFLDEIGDMPMALQAKLLRFVQGRSFERIGGRTAISVDVRIICATNHKLDEAIKVNTFREDLYYRLSEMVINIPPLREREGDAVLLARHFLNAASHSAGRQIRGFSADAAAALTAYSWPGNVRELENRVKRAAIMADGEYVTALALDLPQSGPNTPAPITTLRTARERAEREAVQRALALAEGNVSKAAKLLDISRPTLYTLMQQHKMQA